MILGIDEVGRGPWAGPLVIGAVVLGDPLSPKWQGLNDSKKLSAFTRKELKKKIKNCAVATGLGWVPAAELDEVGAAEALKLATTRAVCAALKIEDFSELPAEKDLPFTEIIIDGPTNFLAGTPLEKYVTNLNKADAMIKEVSAASIIAKVARDHYMEEISHKYPGYGFERHVGYGTPQHKDMLERLGPCPEHRLSVKPVALVASRMGFAKQGEPKNSRAVGVGCPHPSSSWREPAMSEATKPLAKQHGDRAEQIVADYLEKSKGHKILARNHKTKFYEIDIVSATKDYIYFTEVKYRKSSDHGHPLDFIDRKKQKQMAFAAESFMKLLAKKLNRPQDDLPSPILAAASVIGEEFELETWFEISQ